MDQIGTNVRRLRIEAGLTQPQLAERAGIEQGYLSKLENARATPSDEVLERLATALGATPADLRAATGQPPRRVAAYLTGASIGVAAVVIGVLMAAPEPPPKPRIAPDAPLTVTAALDAAAANVTIRRIVGGEPGRMMSIFGIAQDESDVRRYLDVLAPLGEVNGIEFDPIPWWRLGGVEFEIYIRIPE